jgi:hypothetical protein
LKEIGIILDKYLIKGKKQKDDQNSLELTEEVISRQVLPFSFFKVFLYQTDPIIYT